MLRFDTFVCSALIAIFAFNTDAHAATDVASSALTVGAPEAPNVLFVLDDSGSMVRETLPDNHSDRGYEYAMPRAGRGDQIPDYNDANLHNFYLRSSFNNTVYYNPLVTYSRWVRADGSQFAPADPLNAPYDPQLASPARINLSVAQSLTQRWVRNTSTTSLTSRTTSCSSGSTCSLTFWPATFFVYKGTGSVALKSSYVRYRIEGSTINALDLGTGGAPSNVSGGKVTWANGVTRTGAQELQNFANWFSFHRTRISAAKAGVTGAFSQLGAGYRVGFRTINARNEFLVPTTGGFAESNRETWFNRVINQTASGSTPLRTALNAAGQYFEKTTGANDPWGPYDENGKLVGCRQSFTILTTDGYYSDAGTSLSGVSGNVDGSAGRPYADSHSGTLADIALHYYQRDLRSDIPNYVPTTATDSANWQHMVTFGVAFGLSGTLAHPQDLDRIKAGTLAWPNPNQSNDSLTDLKKLDDLWHATVNGRGKFVSAATPSELSAGLKSALQNITQRTSSVASLAVSTKTFKGSSLTYQARFTSGLWTGDIWAIGVSATGDLESVPQWRAAEGIASADTRKIYTRNGATGVSFAWDSLSAAQQAVLGSASMVAYLRGDDANEEENGGPHRTRASRLGDIINSTPAYVGAPDPLAFERSSWAGASQYKTFASQRASRRAMLYVAANDGMLHAFDAQTGEERFAFIPSNAFSKLKGLSEADFAHQFINDGSPAAAEIFDTASSQWRTYVVGAQGRGGNQLYALDVTDPDSVTAASTKWEFSHPELGLLTGTPVIARLKSGSWAVLVGNGYNSDTEQAALFVIDVVTGALIRKIQAGKCSETGCSNNGIAQVTPWDEDGDGGVDFVYGGDLQGNLWRFDLSSSTPAEWNASFGTSAVAQPFFRAMGPDGQAQPITSTVEVYQEPMSGKRWISFGTGKFLGNSDLTSVRANTWYGLQDSYPSGLTSSPIKSRSDLARRQILVESTSTSTADKTRVISAPGDTQGGEAVVSSKGSLLRKGWYLDLVPPSGLNQGERITSGVQIFGNVLFAATMVPTAEACVPGGSGWLLAIDPYTGGRLSNNVFATRDPVSVGAEGSESQVWVSGVSVKSSPSSPILLRDYQLAGAPEITPVPGQSEALVGGTDTSTKREKLSLPDQIGRLSWRELIAD